MHTALHVIAILAIFVFSIAFIEFAAILILLPDLIFAQDGDLAIVKGMRKNRIPLRNIISATPATKKNGQRCIPSTIRITYLRNAMEHSIDIGEIPNVQATIEVITQLVNQAKHPQA